MCNQEISGCTKCGNELICQECEEGKYIKRTATEADRCEPCGDINSDCGECTMDGKCTKCNKPNYYISTSNNITYHCSNSISGCKECNVDGTKCSACQTGKYLATETSCVNCNAGANAVSNCA